jgi:hypothetical protein
VLILNSGSDGFTQISDYLRTLANAGTQDFVPLQSLQIISHRSASSLLLGSSTLTTGSFKKIHQPIDPYQCRRVNQSDRCNCLRQQRY